jgi:hypothetical protein
MYPLMASQLNGPPERYDMPDLSELSENTMLTALLLALTGEEPITGTPGRPLYLNIVRLSDKAVMEYEAARKSLTEFASQRAFGVWSPLFRGVDHLENCITALARALLYVKALRSELVVSLPEINTAVAENIRRLRHRVEHTDEDIVQGKLAEGHAPFLEAASDRVYLREVEVTFDELVDTIRQVDAVVQALVQSGQASAST